jgi:hypothetical protein
MVANLGAKVATLGSKRTHCSPSGSALAAQAIYLGQPLFGSTAAEGGWSAAAEMLANPQESRTFASFLRKEGEID